MNHVFKRKQSFFYMYLANASQKPAMQSKIDFFRFSYTLVHYWFPSTEYQAFFICESHIIYNWLYSLNHSKCPFKMILLFFLLLTIILLKVSDIDQHVERLMEKITSGSLLTKKVCSSVELQSCKSWLCKQWKRVICFDVNNNNNNNNNYPLTLWCFSRIKNK